MTRCMFWLTLLLLLALALFGFALTIFPPRYCASDTLKIDVAREKAKAALLLRCTVTRVSGQPCGGDLCLARATAELRQVPLLLWVGNAPKDVCDALPQVVHCALPKYAKYAAGTLVIPLPDGDRYWEYGTAKPEAIVAWVEKIAALPKGER